MRTDAIDSVAKKERRGQGPRCRVCNHDKRKEIEDLYADGRLPRWISDWMLKKDWQPHIKDQAIRGHFERCVAGEIMKAEGANRSAEAFLQSIEGLSKRIKGYLDQFDDSGHVCAKCRDTDEDAPKPKEKDFRAAAALLREARSICELWGKTLGHIRPDMEINIMTNPQFTAIINPICQITAGCARCAPLVDAAIDG